jgi:hypothetical protein
MAAENALIASLRDRVGRVEAARKAARRSGWVRVALGVILFLLLAADRPGRGNPAEGAGAWLNAHRSSAHYEDRFTIVAEQWNATFPDRSENHDTAQGRWRPLNLERPPFGFPPPLRVLNEKCTEAGGAFRDKSLAVWWLQDLAV